MTRILVTGSRDWWDAVPIRTALLQAAADYPSGRPTLVHGAAAGADLIAAGLASLAGWNLDPHPLTDVDWRVYGKAAGHLRNQRMVELGADVCLAFFMPCRRSCRKPKPHDSHGATDCVERAERAGIPVRPHWAAPREWAATINDQVFEWRDDRARAERDRLWAGPGDKVGLAHRLVIETPAHAIDPQPERTVT